jgi:hypothetical protein
MKKSLLFILIFIFSTISFSSIKAVMPKNNQEEVDLKIIFKWSYESDQNDKKVKFRLYISENPNIKEEDLKLNNLFSNFYAGDVLKPQTTYYWKIEALSEGKVIDSQTFRFKTRELQNGDIYQIFFENYKSLIPYGKYFIGINNDSFEIIDENKNKIKTINVKGIIENIYKKEIIYIKTKEKLYLLYPDMIIKEFNFDKKIIKVNEETYITTKNEIYEIKSNKIEKIYSSRENIIDTKIFDQHIIISLKNKIQILDFDMKNIKEINFKEEIQQILTSKNKIFIITKDYIQELDKNYDEIKRLNFKISSDKLNRKYYIHSENMIILAGNNTLQIYNEKLELIKNINYEEKYDYFISLNEDKYVLIGEKIKAFDNNNKNIWSYSSISPLTPISKPYKDGSLISIGITDYVDRYIIFFEEDITNETNYKKVIQKIEQDSNEKENQTKFEKTEEKIPKDTENTVEPMKNDEDLINIDHTEPATVENTINEITEEPTPLNITENATKIDLEKEIKSLTQKSTETTKESTITNFTKPATKIDNIKEPNIFEQIFGLVPKYDYKINFDYDEIDEKQIKITWDGTPITDNFIIELNDNKTLNTVTTESTEATLTLEKNKNYNLKLFTIKDGKKINLDSKDFKTTNFQKTVILDKLYDEYAYKVVSDENNFYIAGYESRDSWKAKIIKINKNLKEKKEYIFGGDGTDFFKDIIITKDASENANLVAIGDTSSKGLNGDAYIVSITSDGTINYEINYGDFGRDSGISISNIDDENYVVSGNFFTNNRLTDIFVSKYTKDGARIWTNNFGGKNLEIANSVVNNSNQGFIVVGYTRSFGYGKFDIYAINIDYYGKEKWSNVYGDENDDIPVGTIKLGKKYYIIYENEGEEIYHSIVELDENKGFGNSFKQKSEYKEKLLGTKVINDEIYTYGYREKNNKKLGIVYKINIEQKKFEEFLEIELDGDYQIIGLDIQDEYIYTYGNIMTKRNTNNIVITRDIIQQKNQDQIQTKDLEEKKEIKNGIM